MEAGTVAEAVAGLQSETWSGGLANTKKGAENCGFRGIDGIWTVSILLILSVVSPFDAVPAHCNISPMQSPTTQPETTQTPNPYKTS